MATGKENRQKSVAVTTVSNDRKNTSKTELEIARCARYAVLENILVWVNNLGQLIRVYCTVIIVGLFQLCCKRKYYHTQTRATELIQMDKLQIAALHIVFLLEATKFFLTFCTFYWESDLVAIY